MGGMRERVLVTATCGAWVRLDLDYMDEEGERKREIEMTAELEGEDGGNLGS